MVSDVVMTENDVVLSNVPEIKEDTIGLGFYNIDSHIVRYIEDAQGNLSTEGGTFVFVPSPFPISSGAVIPRSTEAQNVLVVCCPSTSHVAFCAIRMEPTFMIMAQACAVLAVLSIDQKVPVGQVSHLKEKLESCEQVLHLPILYIRRLAQKHL